MAAGQRAQNRLGDAWMKVDNGDLQFQPKETEQPGYESNCVKKGKQ
jgi:hypothetical protein